jgi:flagellar motor switch/type III secretory pathway protein FliN
MKKTLLLFCGLLISFNVNALNIGGIHLQEQIQVGDKLLQLNGAGIRTPWFFKTYVCGLYLLMKETSDNTIIDRGKENRIVLHILREQTSSNLYVEFKEAIESNQTMDVLLAIQTQLNQMGQIFESVELVKEGDIITLDYLPSSGTKITVNGTARGTIFGAGFNRAILGIWLGDHPISDDMKQGMLGG